VKPDEVIELLTQAKVDEAFEAVEEVPEESRKDLAQKLTEFAGTLNLVKGRDLLCETLLKKSLTLDYENPYTHYNIGVLYTNPGYLSEHPEKLEKALLAYENALKYKPTFHMARYNLALLYFFNGEKVRAQRLYDEIVDAVGDVPEYRELGMLLLRDKL